MPIADHNHVTAERLPLAIDFRATRDVPALIRFGAAEWGRDHIMSLGRDLLMWQFGPGRFGTGRTMFAKGRAPLARELKRPIFPP